MKYSRVYLIGRLIGILLFIPVSLMAQTDIQFRHAPVLCAIRDVPLRISFEVLASAPPAEVRVYFKASQADAYYFVQPAKDAAGDYTAVLPSPAPETTIVDYLLFAVDADGQAVKTESMSAPIDAEASCPQDRRAESSAAIIVRAEQTLPPEIGFAGNAVKWETTAATTSLLDMAKEIMLLRPEPVEQEGEMKTAKQSGRWGKKALIGLGVGAGAAAGAAVALNGGGDDGGSDGDSWDSVGNQAKNVFAQVVKTPPIQTNCGISVVNQLTIRNDLAGAIVLGTIDYQVALTKDKPAGSCVSGRSGSFAPDGVEVVAPGQTVLVREWLNEVNPCGNCPYITAECVWESRYIVHTSAGSVVARSTFSTQGNLCDSGSQKAIRIPTQISPDIE